MESLKEFGAGAWNLVYDLKPSFLSRKPTFNFITYHYFWIIGNTLFASALLSAFGTKIGYIDALFLGSGSATQSGLNTVDINLLSLGQQIVLYTIPMFTNPVFINAVLVLVRYVLFQIRFKAVAEEALRRRRTISKARGRDITDEERGLDGRDVIVMHNETGPTGSKSEEVEMAPLPKEEENGNEQPPSSSSSGNALSSHTDSDSEPDGSPLKPQITFAEQPPKPSNGMLSIDTRPTIRATTEQHIAFLERQRRGSDAVLRIPSPRDAEMGVAPRAVDESDIIARVHSSRPSIYSRMSLSDRINVGDDDDTSERPTAPRRAITIAEPIRPTDAQSSTEDLSPTRDTFGGAPKIRRPNWTRRTTKPAKDNDANGAELHPIRSRIPTLATITSYFKSNNENLMPYLSWNPTIGRNSNFADLTEEQREELGGIEYRSLKTLILTLVVYFLGFTVTGTIGLLPWIVLSGRYGKVVNDAGVGRPWWAVYTSSSAFNDVGFTLTPDSMISFNSSRWTLLLMSVLIIAGNTGFPILLRIIIWLLSKIVPKGSGWDEEFQFLLDHPRRCFTLLFPAKATWALFWILVGLNGCDLLLYVILDLTNPVVSSAPVSIRVLDGWFQAVSTRTAGFTVVDLSLLHPAVQVSYLIMMYISVLPIAISVRRTNVYEERSLGVYDKQPKAHEIEEGREPSYVGSHLRAQLSFDLPYIALGFFLVTIIEGNRIGKDPRFSMFAVLFEIISAYGTVGLSLGYPGTNTSFSFKLKTLSKLIIICMQIRGRHRGLPYGLDMAIILPSEKQQMREAEEAAAQQIQRRLSTASAAPLTLHRTGTRSSDRGGGRNFFSGLMHPGPPMPAAYRRPHREDTLRAPTLTRQPSSGTTGVRRDSRDGQPNRGFFFSGFSSGAANGTGESRPVQRPEGRRQFYQEGVNPLPTASVSAEPQPQKDEGKQA